VKAAVRKVDLPTSRVALCALAVLCVVAPSQAANHYVRAGASGGGGSWADAYGSLPSTLVRGDTYYVADGVYGGCTFDDAGTSTITIRKATAVDHGTDTGWNAAYGDGVARFGNLNFSRQHYVFDGVVGGGPDQWRSGHGFEVTGTGNIINLTVAAAYIEFRHVQIHGPNLSEHSRGINGTTGNDIHHITVAYCWMHTNFGVPFYMLFWDQSTVEYSCIENNKSTPEWHAEGIVATGADRIVIRYCLWKNIIIAGINSGYASDDWEIYGNVIQSSTYFIYMYNEPEHTNHTWADGWRIYNNTIAGPTQRGTIAGDIRNTQIYNNIWHDFQEPNNYMTLQSGDRRYNSFYDVDFRGTPPSGPTNLFLSGDPMVNHLGEDWSLAGPTVAGTALPAPYNVDMHDNVRGADGAWDRGAIEYVAAPPPVADAGPDRTVEDADGDGLALVVLDGTGSRAPGGTIVDYLWTEDGKLLGFDALQVAVFAAGAHTITLKITDSNGATASDTVVVTVDAAAPKPGDANGDRAVDLEDFVILKRNFNRTDAAWSDGDFTGDGKVDLEDFVVLKQNFGT